MCASFVDAKLATSSSLTTLDNSGEEGKLSSLFISSFHLAKTGKYSYIKKMRF